VPAPPRAPSALSSTPTPSATTPRSPRIGVRRCGQAASPARRAGCGRRRWPASPIQNRSRLRSNGSCPMRSRVLRVGAAVLLCVLAACRTAPVFFPAPAPWVVRRPRLQALTQSGWHIDYSLYVAVGGESLPARLTLRRDAVRVRLLVDDWQL